MSHLKDYVKATSDVMHFLTYADNYAIGYFKKQGFTKEIMLERRRWMGYIKDYEGGTIMQCSMLPKIRYLESGGLINPERTPAGYRRFSEEDVEKLRWVLAAQRDQYLPLKVIRQHLAADGPRSAADDPEGIVAALTSGADFGAGDPDLELAEAEEFGDVRPLTPPLPPIPQPRARAATVADPEFYETTRADVGELHLGREGLARTAGVSESFVADLVSFGLLPHTDAYGGDAVFIVRAASALTEFGLEPRHLRPLLTGARNAAGLLEGLLPTRRHDGVVTPGRQAAANRAAARSAQASAAAVKLYAALLRAELAPGIPAPAASGESSSNPGMPGGPVAR